MRSEYKDIIRAHLHEIIDHYDLFEPPVIEDWWWYLDNVAINVHDYDEDGIISVNIYDYFDDAGVVDMQESYDLTLEELKKL